ncbi:MAG: homocysteine S-methyltransferase family protein [Fimbriimonadaceae bacterium]|nr:homocysteine S-methyltransferase family protein [Fimbriimonadaceae bacterium]
MAIASSLLDRLAQGVMVFDGAMGTQIQAADLHDRDFVLDPDGDYPPAVREAARRLNGNLLDGCNEILCFTRPDAIRTIHEHYLEAGSDMVQANTFGASGIVLAEYEIAELDYEIGLAAGRIAREAADRHCSDDKPRFVVGAMGPGTKLVSLGQTTWDELEGTYRRCFRGLLEAGVDALMLETLQDLLMVKAALRGARLAMDDAGRDVPVFVQVTMEQTGTMLVGSELGAALNTIEAFPWVQVIGINCATGPVEMATHVRFLGDHSTRPISIQPNAGLPIMEGGRAVYKLSPEEMVVHQTRFVEDHGVAIVGGCCGTTPAHIRALADALGGRPHGNAAHWQRVREVYPGFDFSMGSPERESGLRLQGCSSLYQFVPYKQDSSFLIVGEKTNANGSKAFRDMLGAENWDGLVELARELEGEGSHMLDVCTAYVGRDEVRDMTTLLGHYNRQVTVPIMIDSTEAPVIEAALRKIGGKPLINSINFEDGETRTRRVLGLCRDYGAGVVALTIDESGMAKTTEHKVAVADRLLAATREFGLADHDVFIDCLTFTLGSGDEEFRRSAIATIEAIRETRARHPRVNFTLGVSNVSFGLKPAARQVLNSAFLHYCLEAGLTSAIVHFSKIRPENRIEPEIWQIASDLVFDRRRYKLVGSAA